MNPGTETKATQAALPPPKDAGQSGIPDGAAPPPKKRVQWTAAVTEAAAAPPPSENQPRRYQVGELVDLLGVPMQHVPLAPPITSAETLAAAKEEHRRASQTG